MMFHVTICQHCGKPVPVDAGNGVCVLCGNWLGDKVYVNHAEQEKEAEWVLAA